jgi:flavin-dependent dehydrogenase
MADGALTSSDRFEADVAIVGGGPSGATLAALLADRGLHVAVIDASGDEPSRRAESLSRGALSLISHLGLERGVEAATIPGVRRRSIQWRGEETESTEADSALVDRGRFDQALRSAAISRGATVIAARAEAPTRTATGWRIGVRGEESLKTVSAALLVDASGRRGFGKRRLERLAPTVAASGRWTGAGDGERLVAGSIGWGWGISLGADASEVTIFVDPAELRDKGTSLASKYATLTRAIGVVNVARADLSAQTVSACDATSRLDGMTIAHDFLRVGDAAMTADPLASAGLQLALQQAVFARAAIATLREDRGNVPLVAEFWRQELARRWRRHSNWAGALHREAGERFGTVFWRRRARQSEPTLRLRDDPLPTPTAGVLLSSEVEFSAIPCLVGDRIVRRCAVGRRGYEEQTVFVEGEEIGSFLREALDIVPAGTLALRWARRVGLEVAVRLLSWAWRRRMVVEAHSECTSI